MRKYEYQHPLDVPDLTGQTLREGVRELIKITNNKSLFKALENQISVLVLFPEDSDDVVKALAVMRMILDELDERRERTRRTERK